MKTIALTKTHANVLLLNLENNKKKPINRTQRKRMKVIYQAFDAVIEDFIATKDALVTSCQKEMDAVTIDDNCTQGEKQSKLGEIDRRYGGQLKEVKDTEGKDPVDITLEDGDFQIVRDIWQAQDGFSSGREESQTADVIDDAFELAVAVQTEKKSDQAEKKPD